MKKLLSVILLLVLFVLSACGETTELETQVNTTVPNETESKSEGQTSSESKVEDVYFKDGEVKLNDLKIKITSYSIIQPGEEGNEYGDKPVIAFWYDTTNLSDKDINPSTAWMVVFNAIQDNNPNAVNDLDVGMLPDDSHLDSQLETIKKGGTVSNSVAYELDDLETPVTLIASQGLLGDEIGKLEFSVK